MKLNNTFLKNLLYIIVCGFLPLVSYSQSAPEDDFKVKIVPPSPEASALAKYGDIPVSNYTGVPNIDIPIFTVTGRELSVPISLSYHAGGFRVEERASWVGLGWSLNAGGVISRTVRGIKDESDYGYLSLSDTQYDDLADCDSDLLQDISAGVRDAEPDLFFFNVNGVSGKFFFDHNGNILLESPQHYVIQYTGGAGNEITNWTLVTDDGTKYEFTEIETTSHRTVLPVLDPQEYTNTSWYLTKMVAANGLDEIVFYYDTFSQSVNINVSERYLHPYVPIVGACTSGSQYTCPEYGPVKTKTETTVVSKRLSRIVTENHEAVFSATFSRLDLPGQMALSDILIKDSHGQDLRKVIFSYSHFNSGSGRLKLTGVQQLGLLGTAINNPPHIFSYNEVYNLPAETSMAQDYWGYYNAANSNTTLVPEELYFNPQGAYELLSGANREPNASSTLANLLTKITYPTGGYTDLEYEPHSYGWIKGEQVSEPILQNLVASVDAVVPGTDCDPMAAVYEHSSQFTIDYDQVVTIYATIDQCTPAIGATAPYVQLLDNLGAQLLRYDLDKDTPSGQFQDYISLTAGTYTLKGKVRVYDDRASASLHYTTQIGISHEKLAGGARIKKITSSPGSGQSPVVKEYFYVDESTGWSSGVLIGEVKFTNEQEDQKVIMCSSVNGEEEIVYYCNYHVRSSNTQLPLSTTSGSHVGYQYVKVKTSGNGSEAFEYTSPRGYADLGDSEYPFIAKTSFDWARGKLLKHDVVSESGNTLQRQTNNYNLQYLTGAKGRLARRLNPHTEPPLFQCKFYDQISALAQLTSTINESFAGGTTFTQQTSYTYDPVKGSLTKSTTTTNSRNQSVVTSVMYPFDVASISGLTADEIAALNDMVSRNMVATSIETATLVDSQPTEKILTNFKIIPINNSQYSTVTSSVVPESQEVAIGNAPYRTVKTFKDHNEYANPEGYFNVSGVENAFIWQSKGRLSASIENATITEVAYNGFEIDEGDGQWSFTLNSSSESKSGGTSHSLNGYSISKSSLTSAKKYVVSFWAKNGIPNVTNVLSSNDDPAAGPDGWRYFEKLVTGTTTVTISGTSGVLVDELRLYPEGALMSTYTYNSIGLTSKTGPNSVLTYYEYDALGQLHLVRDHNGNILKTYKYHYKGQQEEASAQQ